MKLDGYLTTQQAARVLGVTTRWIFRLIEAKKMSPAGKIGKSFLFAVAEVERMKARNRTPGPKKG